MMTGNLKRIKFLKASFWVILLVMLFSGMVITADMFGYPVPIPSLSFHRPGYRYFTNETGGNDGDTANIARVITTTMAMNGKINTKNVKELNSKNHSVTEANQQHQTQEKITHIGFLKVHKAGSTTMQNMFFRFGLKHRLNILIPNSGNYLLSKGAALVPKTEHFSHYDVFACHTVYSKSLYSQILPSDHIKIGIIREPLDRMVSAAYYYRDIWGVDYLKAVPKANFIHNLVNKPEQYEKAFFSRTRNSMGKDFGFPGSLRVSDKASVEQRLDTLNKEFSLVLMTERFDESLILMKRLLKWSFSDIVYLLANTHAHKPTILTKEELEKFQTTSFLDYAIYDYFSKVFMKKVDEAGKDLQDEVNFFKETLVKVKTFCDNVNSTTDTLQFPQTKWDSSFLVSKADCAWMKTAELRFIDQLRGFYKGNIKVNYETGPLPRG